MRLIDADALLKDIEKYHVSEGKFQHWVEIQPTIDTEPHWIPCSERLPEEDFETGAGVQYSEHVEITVYNEMDDETFVDNGYTINGEWISDTTDHHIPRYWKVLAWQPMPEPWKGET